MTVLDSGGSELDMAGRHRSQKAFYRLLQQASRFSEHLPGSQKSVYICHWTLFRFGEIQMLLVSVLLTFACLSAIPQETDGAEFEVHESIVYAKFGDKELLLDAFVPVGEGPHPAVLVVHGGAWRSGNRRQLAGYANALARQGVACFAIDYRLAPEHKFPAQIEDCRAAVKWVRAHAKEYNVNPNRFGAIGYSAGGHLVCLLATTGEAPAETNGFVDTRLQAVVAGGAPTDFRVFPDDGRWAAYWMCGDLKTVSEKFRDASAPVFADENDPPVFFFNGTADELVPVKWSMSCYDALKAKGVKVEMHTIEGANHLQAAMNATALKKAGDFLLQELTTAREVTPAEKTAPKSGN